MRKFYEAYEGNEIVAPLARQLPWTHNLIILNQSKRPEEREFYLRLAIREKWSSRQLERQLKTALFERTLLSPVKVSPLVSQTYSTGMDRHTRPNKNRFAARRSRKAPLCATMSQETR